jgi:hypothetical protein
MEAARQRRPLQRASAPAARATHRRLALLLQVQPALLVELAAAAVALAPGAPRRPLLPQPPRQPLVRHVLQHLLHAVSALQQLLRRQHVLRGRAGG